MDLLILLLGTPRWPATTPAPEPLQFRHARPEATGRAVLAAIIALLASYNAMQIGLYGLFAAAAAGFVSENLGIDLPWWVYAFLAMAIIAVLGYRQVDLFVKVLAILVGLELIAPSSSMQRFDPGRPGGTAPPTATLFTGQFHHRLG